MGTSTTQERAPHNAAGEERPAFLLEFPEHAALVPLIQLFEEGNFYELRKCTKSLIKTDLPENVRKAAEQLLLRTQPDPAMMWMLALCWLLFSFVVGWTYFH